MSVFYFYITIRRGKDFLENHKGWGPLKGNPEEQEVETYKGVERPVGRGKVDISLDSRDTERGVGRSSTGRRTEKWCFYRLVYKMICFWLTQRSRLDESSEFKC